MLNAEPLALKVEDLSTARGSQAKIDLQAAINRRGRVGVGSSVGLTAVRQPRPESEGRRSGDAAAPRHRAGGTSRSPAATSVPAASWFRAASAGAGKDAAMKRSFKGQPDDRRLRVRWTSSTLPTSPEGNRCSSAGWTIRLAPMAVSIDDIALTDFYAPDSRRQGRLNIREITAQRAGAATGRRGGGEAGTKTTPRPGTAVAPVAAAPAGTASLSIRRIHAAGQQTSPTATASSGQTTTPTSPAWAGG